ncbi:GntR family transcriptional regulator [Streptomyces kronopolitis]|uniref:GntR family transcriptional regulator n=2 Tax=Streptomyces kronopolitis TaxID=1612435 RepID=A0ABQ2JE86_9ACTN|nr:FadR/GntR family transcriptional regulator [Streptomyces kronopolitis]GGN45769.1 GntR family transcriptional regulator [Streptomyces kronopolitis]
MADLDSRTAAVPSRRVNAMEVVLRDLRGAIERGDYEVGDKLPSEAELGHRFEVSRSVVREALRAMQALGLTSSRAGKGTYVASPGATEDPTFGAYSSRDLVEVRRHVEIPVAAYAATRRTQDDLDLLDRLLVRMERQTDTTAWVALDTLFHITIAQSAGNPVFRKVIEEIRDALARQSTFLDMLARDRREQSNREHRAIVEAIVDRSEDDAVRAMTAHLEHVEWALTTIVRPDRAGAEGREAAPVCRCAQTPGIPAPADR